MGNDILLPKNIRQIGEVQGRQKIYLEDYVMTYIRKMEQKGSEAFLGILLGERRCTDDAEYVFVRGIMEVPEEPKESDTSRMAEADEKKTLQTGRVNSGTKQDAKKDSAGEKTPEKEKTGLWQAFQKRYGTQEQWSTEETVLETALETAEKQNKQEKETAQNSSEPPKDRWEVFCREQEAHFPESGVVGCCVIGTWENGRMEELTQRIPEARQLLYHLQDQEERLYWLEGERYEGIGGYFVFYEQNRQMQEYLSELFGESSVEKESAPDNAIISFREKVKNKADEKSRSFLKLASSFFVVGALIVGVIAVNRVSDLRQAASVGSTASLEEGQEMLSDSGNTFSNASDSNSDNISDSNSDGVSVETPETEESSVSVSADAESDMAELSGIEDNETETARVSDILSGSDAFWADDETVEAAVSDTADEASEMNAAETASGTNAVSEAESASGTNMVSEAESASDTSGTPDTEAAVTATSRQVQASYVIRTGDTLAEICAKYYGSLDQLEELCEANGIEDANLIIPGQKIVLP